MKKSKLRKLTEEKYNELSSKHPMPGVAMTELLKEYRFVSVTYQYFITNEKARNHFQEDGIIAGYFKWLDIVYPLLLIELDAGFNEHEIIDLFTQDDDE